MTAMTKRRESVCGEWYSCLFERFSIDSQSSPSMFNFSRCHFCSCCPCRLYSTEMFKFEVPSLTVGTLDTLMVRDTLWWNQKCA